MPDEKASRDSAQGLLARYLKTVTFLLPREGKDDILAELKGDLCAQVEEEERELGRALSVAEMEALLDRWGHPLRVTGRYREPRHLIGPELFPLYLRALRAIALVYLGPWLLVWLGLVALSPAYRAAHPGVGLLATLASFVSLVVYSFGAVTAGFALLEWRQARTGRLLEWNPRSAPEEHGAPRDPHLISRASSGAGIGVLLVFLAWWLRPSLPAPAQQGASAPWLELYRQLFVPVLLLALGRLALLGLNWFRPRWTRARLGLRAGLAGLGMAVMLRALRGLPGVADQLAALEAARAADAEAEGIASLANVALFFLLLVLAGVLAASFLADAVRIVRWRSAPVRAAGLLAALVASASLTPDVRAQSTAPALPTDEAIRQILARRIDVERRSLGIVIGILTPAGRRIVAHGRTDGHDGRPVDGDTVFEIGSVSKVFTSLLLADMVERGEVALSDPVARLLPAEVKVPEWRGRRITLVDLATQTSGLPFFPDDLPDAEGEAAPAYTQDHLYAFLSDHELLHDVGVHWEYSNLGVGLLGHALARRAGKSFDELLRERITVPLGLESTGVAPTPSMQARLAAGHDAQGKPAPSWDLGVLAAAGGLRSSANDLLTLLGAFAGEGESPLAAAMAAMGETRRPADYWLAMMGGQQALGWWVIGPSESEVLAHSGETAGFSCSAACDLAAGVGVVALSNSAGSGSDLALHLLRRFPLSSPPAPRVDPPEIQLAPELLDRLAGKYEAGPDVIFVVRRRGDALGFQGPSSPSARLHAESPTRFFFTNADAAVTFELDPAGRATGLVLHLSGMPVPARRIDLVELER